MTESAAGARSSPAWRGILALCRVSNLPTVWMNALAAVVLCAASGAIPAVPWPALALLLVSMSALYCAGMGLNDLCDREHDARHQPFRPLPAGRVTVPEAAAVTAALFVLGLGLLLLAPVPALLPGLALAALIVLYDALHKRHPATVLLMAACRLGVFGVCALAVAGRVPASVAAAGGVQFAWTLLVTVVARHEGRRGRPYAFPLIPRMIAAMSLLDGAVLAVAAAPAWLAVGLAAALATRGGQRFVRGS